MHSEARGYDHFGGVATEFSSTSTPWYPVPTTARKGSPNVIIVLVDDMGFSDVGAYGSEIETPNVNALASEGWTFTDFHTAPLCSPSRASLLTGVNPHRLGFGMVVHVDPGYPGYACEIPKDVATLPETLRAGGYANFMVGKWHLTGEARMHDGADKSSWPLQRGFDRYYGTMDGFTTLYHPHRLIRDNSVVDIPEFSDDYFLTDDLTDQAIAMIDELRANDDEKPFFLYFAHAAVHGPVQAKAADIEKYRDRYAAGWDEIRSGRLSRQIELGLFSAGTELPVDSQAGGGHIPDWDSLSPEDQLLFARHMEVYAASVDSVDQSLGRVLARLEELGERENTIVIFASDNGGTAEGGIRGTRSYFSKFNTGVRLPEDWVDDVPRDLDLVGGPRVHGHYPAGWARVSNTPFRSFKGSVYEGGVHAPLIISWPNAPEAYRERGLRDHLLFVSDIAPTVLELTGVPRLTERGGQPTIEPDGVSAASVLRSREAEAIRNHQYFECAGSRALIDGSWKIVSARVPTLDEGAAGGDWELYHVESDPTETIDRASAEPALVGRLARNWRDEAWRNTVFPLSDDGTLFTVRPATELKLAKPVTLPAFRPPLERFRSSRLTVLRSFAIEAELQVGEASAGVILAHGDQGGGYLLAIDNGAPLISYNAYGNMHRARGAALTPGTHRLTLRFDEIEGLRWRIHLEIDGQPNAELATVPMLLGMAPFTGISVGYDYGGPVDWELHEAHRNYRFTGGVISRLRYVPGERSSYDHTVIRAIGDAAFALAD